MSSQSINQFEINETSNNIDDYLICEGNAFRNIVDYDLKMKVDYDKLRYLLYLKEMLNRTKDCEKVIYIINKTLI